ncbi:UNVERIFIED_CONTAM: hypothetical protein Sindi_2195500 [Sesamum indicum]
MGTLQTLNKRASDPSPGVSILMKLEPVYNQLSPLIPVYDYCSVVDTSHESQNCSHILTYPDSRNWIPLPMQMAEGITSRDLNFID